jgi:hypothetical protein
MITAAAISAPNGRAKPRTNASASTGATNRGGDGDRLRRNEASAEDVDHEYLWPVTALFASLLALRGYFKYDRAAAGGHTEGKARQSDTPFSVAVAKGATHCGAGCTIGDILAEWLAFTFPAVAVWFGWRSLFQEKLFAVWVLAYAFAFVLGTAFQ